MTHSNRPHHSQLPDDGLADFIRRVSEIFAEREAANPTPPRPPEPWIDKPGTLIAAEKDFALWKVLARIQRPLCQTISSCKDQNCRRTNRCRELILITKEMEASRMRLAGELAKWQPSPTRPAEPPRPNPTRLRQVR